MLRHAERSRRASANASPMRETSLPPASATSGDPPPPPPTMAPSVRTKSVEFGFRPPGGRPASATFTPSGEPAHGDRPYALVTQHRLGQRPQGVALCRRHGGPRQSRRRGSPPPSCDATDALDCWRNLVSSLGRPRADGSPTAPARREQLIGLSPQQPGRGLEGDALGRRTRSRATRPVTAKIRRLFEPMLSSDTNAMGPICPSESTWVPPQNSNDRLPGSGRPRARSRRTCRRRRRPLPCARPPQRGLGGRHRLVAQHGGIGQIEHGLELFGRRLSMMRKVEAQPVRRHQRALLAHVVAQHGAQGRVQQVRGRVIAPDGLAAFAVNGGQSILTQHELAAQAGPMGDQPGEDVHRIEHLGPPHSRSGWSRCRPPVRPPPSA